MKCVVCDEPIAEGREHYSNAWERSRKKSPCCGAPCAGVFNPDEHWMPALMPDLASEEEQHRLLDVVRLRLKDGDTPTVVLHEMLLAGVSPLGLRKQINEAFVAGDRHRKTARQLSVLGVVKGILGGGWSFSPSTDKRKPDALEAALADLDRWEVRVAERAQRTS